MDEIPWYDAAYATDIWKPVDASYGATLKAFVKQFSVWLDDDENCENETVQPVKSQQVKNVFLLVIGAEMLTRN